MNIRLMFEPRDIWIGLYWKKEKAPKIIKSKFMKQPKDKLYLWICIIPMLPIRIIFGRF